MGDKHRRLARIRELLHKPGVLSQEQLSALLRREGIVATQATLSRDLRELRVMKGPGGYVLPDEVSASPTASEPPKELASALRTYLLQAEVGGTVVVLRTGPGQASPLALELDRAVMKGVVGTIAGDDTVFVATRTPRSATQLASSLKHLAGRL